MIDQAQFITRYPSHYINMSFFIKDEDNDWREAHHTTVFIDGHSTPLGFLKNFVRRDYEMHT